MVSRQLPVRILAYVVMAILSSFASGQSFVTEEVRFLSGLRERRLFELAESYCRRELAESYVDRRRRTELTIELSRTILESALYEKPPRRDERFADALKPLDQARLEGPDDPWRVAIGVQRGLIELVHGELLREEAQSLNASESAMAAARDRLRGAIAQLRKSLAAAEVLTRSTAPGAVAPQSVVPTAAEAVAIKRQVEYHLARAYRNQGESYPAGSPDRAAALAEATKGLEQLARSETADELTWQARLDEVVCRRLLGDLDGAERMLTLIDGQSPPTDVAERARAQRIRIRLDAAALDEAGKLIRDADADPAGSTSPDVQLAVLEWMLAQSQAATKAGRSQDAADWQNRAAALTAIIAERQTGYWARRAEILLASAAASAPTGDVALLVKAAESFYQQGNIDRALEVYERAFAKAQETKDDNAAMQIGLTAAAVEEQARRPGAAVARLLALSTAFPKHPDAARAHLSGAYTDFEGVAHANDDERIAQFTQRLREHVERWPTDATARSAHLWLGWMEMRKRNWPAAIAELEQCGPEIYDARLSLTTCWERVLAERKQAGQPLPILEMERSFGIFAPGLMGRLENPSSRIVREAALGAAQFWLRYADDRYAQAASVLTQLADTAPSPADKVAAEAWVVLAEVGLGRYDAALDRAQKITTSLIESQGLIDRLDELTLQRPVESRAKIAAVTLRMAELSRLTTSASPSKAEARALSLVGRGAEARQLWEKLTAAKPNDVDLVEEYAAFLLTQPDRESAQAAAVKWRIVERASKESTPRWYRARLGLAKAYLQAGDKDRATQLIEITTALHPDLGGEVMRREFDALAAELR